MTRKNDVHTKRLDSSVSYVVNEMQFWVGKVSDVLILIFLPDKDSPRIFLFVLFNKNVRYVEILAGKGWQKQRKNILEGFVEFCEIYDLLKC